MTPESPIAMPLMAPCTSPKATARVVPTAWLQVPMPTPWAIGLVILKSLMRLGAMMEPKIPVKMTAGMMMGTMPPSCWETAMAMGVVTDLLIEAAKFAQQQDNGHGAG